MRNVLRRSSALLLCLCLCFGFVPASLAAAPDEPTLETAAPVQDLGGRTVVGFEPLADGGVLHTQSKLPLVTLRQLLPRTLTVRLDDGKDGELCAVAVTWQCVEDYDEDLDEFHFTPVLPGAAPAEGLELPALTVTVEGEDELPPMGYFDSGKPAGAREFDEPAPTKGVRSALPASYNSYELGALPAVRSQGNYGTCWAFAFLGGLEADLIHDGAADTDVELSVLQLAYYTFHDFYDEKGCNAGDGVRCRDDDHLELGGNTWLAYRTYANMVGGAAEQDVPYEWGSDYMPGPWAGRAYPAPQLTGLHELPVFKEYGRDAVKKAIMEHGAVIAEMYMKNKYHSSTYNSYCTDNGSANHSVLLVGWDDSFPKENFGPVKPSTDGAWLLRNSWGGYGPLSGVEYPDYGLKGYFWISYDDACMRDQTMYAVEAQPWQYDHCYGYDATPVPWRILSDCPSPTVLSQNFRVDGGERIEAVGIETQTPRQNVVLRLTCADQTVTTETFTDAVGFHLIPLQTPLTVAEDADVTLELTVSQEMDRPIDVLCQAVGRADYVSVFTGACASGGLTVNGKNVGSDGLLKLYTMDVQAQPPQDGICIDEENFPGTLFRSYVSAELDLDGNGYLSEAERAAATVIDLTGLWEAPDAGTDAGEQQAAAGEADRGAKGPDEAATLTGLEYFPMLKVLLCPGCCLTGLDLSGKAALEELDCSGNLLEELDLSANAALVSLDCSGNWLEELDLAANTALVSLDCSGNLLYDLDLSSNAALERLACGDNMLFDLDLSANTALETLDCGTNTLCELDLSDHAALERLDCSSNWLSSLALTGCAALTALDCSNNELDELDVSGLAALESLACGKNGMTALVLDQNAALAALDCSGNKLTALALGGAPALKSLVCSGNKLGALDAGGMTALEKLDCRRNSLGSLGLTGCTALTTLNCSDNGDLAALDVTVCPALERLECQSCGLSGLDVSQNALLTYLDCAYNALTGLDVTQNAALKHLICRLCGLTGLNVTQNTKLLALLARGNALTELDVSQNTKLAYLDLYGSHLQALDVSENRFLLLLNVIGNSLTQLDVSRCAMLKALYCNGLALTELDLSNNYSLGLLDVGHTELTQLDLYGCSDLCSLYLNCTPFTSGEGEICYLSDDKLESSDPYLDVYGSLTFDTDVTLITDEPQILTQPESVTAWIGDTVTFSVTAQGRDLSYRWYLRRAVHDSWAWQAQTEPEWTMTVTEKDDGCIFRCAVMNDSATVYSDGVMLTVLRRAGDTNGDGPVNGKDATALQRFIAGGYGVKIPFSAADLNHDGVVNAKDAILLMRYLAGGYGVTLE